MVDSIAILKAGILIVDDEFKPINDTLGHDVWDVLLRMVAERLLAMARVEDTVALKAIEAVSQPYEIEGHTLRITTSAGVGIYPVHGEDADTLIKSADLALYEAKRAGKNTYRISDRTGRSTP